MTETAALLRQVIAQMGGQCREGQQLMAEAVSTALDRQSSLLVQAGTGTGKSLAYLVPAVLHAASGKRVLISTATIALQRQILRHDLPLVIAAAKDPLSTGLLKGWSNYVCAHKIAGGYPEEPTLDIETTSLGEQVVRVRSWAQDCDSGDRDDLVPGVNDRAWGQVSVSALECIGGACPQRAQCFPLAAKTHAFTADLVITNHAMLAVAATGSPGALPEFDAIIIDEAHELVQRVTTGATVQLSGAILKRVAGQARRIGAQVSDLEHVALRLDDELAQLTEGRLEPVPQRLSVVLGATRDILREAISSLPACEDLAAKKLAQSALVTTFEVSERLVDPDGADVVWVGGRESAPVLYAAPLDVAGILGPFLAQIPVVATSATLTVGGRFEPLARAAGLAAGASQLDVGTPFDYRKQGVIYVAKHLPPPAQSTPPEQLAEIVDLVQAAGGGTLGLFSSRLAAQRAADHVREHLDVPVLCQGDDLLANLVTAFAADDRACLFGTISLWQGIDVPGDTCRLVIIDRIPFPRPDDPIWSARCAQVNEQGGSGFMAVSLPQAALLLAQGSGRLIRSAQDRGVVALLDSRVATKRYGAVLMRTMPPLWPTTSKDVVLGVLQRLACSN